MKSLRSLRARADRLLVRVLPDAPHPPGRPLPHPIRVGALLFVCLLAGYLFSFNVDQPAYNGDWYIRYQVTCAIVEHNSFAIQPYRADARSGLGVGYLRYAQYTLGQTTAMIPLYLLGRALAGLRHTNCASDIAPPIVFLTCKALGPLLGALLGVLFFATARLLRSPPRRALALTICFAFGTALWPDVLSNLEHTMESLFLLAAVYAALRYTRLPSPQAQTRPGRLWLLVMGLSSGLVFVTRVAGIIAPPIFALYLFLLHRRRSGTARGALQRDLAIYIAGVAPSIILNAAYNLLRFGSPLRAEPHADATFGVIPLSSLPELLLSPGKGLIWYTPAVLLLLLAARRFWRRAPEAALLFGIICAVYLLFYSSVTYWHGDPAWGPRYLYATLPYLILPLDSVLASFRAYRPRVRGIIIAVLALSFLVQLTAVSVSYWRQFHYIQAAHHDQVTQHVWGYDQNYWWVPSQSPIIYSFAGAVDIMHTYVSHRPLLSYPTSERYSVAQDRCDFHPYGRTSVCLTDYDDLRYRANFNTFSLWWLHTYPWWDKGTVVALATILGSLWLGGLVALAMSFRRLERGAARLRTRMSSVRRRASRSTRPDASLTPLSVSAMLAVALFGGMLGVAGASAPARATPFLHVLPMNAVVRDNGWAYRVLRVMELPTSASTESLRYAVVVLQVRNLMAKPADFKPRWFALTDPKGDNWLLARVTRAVSALQAFRLAWSRIRGHMVVERVLIYIVPSLARQLMLLGPGLSLFHLIVTEGPQGQARPTAPASHPHRSPPRHASRAHQHASHAHQHRAHAQPARRGTPAQPPSQYAVTVRDGLRLRGGAGTSTPIVRLLAVGTVLRVVATRGTWLAVVTSDGTHGYVFGPYTSLLQSVTPGEGAVIAPEPATVLVAADGLNLRDRPDLHGGVLAVEPRGTALVLRAYTRHWAFVELIDGSRGWVWRQLTQRAP